MYIESISGLVAIHSVHKQFVPAHLANRASFISTTDSFLWGHDPYTLACKARPSFDGCGTSLSVSFSLSLVSDGAPAESSRTRAHGRRQPMSLVHRLESESSFFFGKLVIPFRAFTVSTLEQRTTPEAVQCFCCFWAHCPLVSVGHRRVGTLRDGGVAVQGFRGCGMVFGPLAICFPEVHFHGRLEV